MASQSDTELIGSKNDKITKKMANLIYVGGHKDFSSTVKFEQSDNSSISLNPKVRDINAQLQKNLLNNRP